MRVLIVHSYYLNWGGEDATFEQEANLLRTSMEVDLLKFYNQKGIRGLFQFLFSIWNLKAASILKERIQAFKPDVIHVHNFHFGCGPIIFHVAREMKVPIVLTVHNYRIICPSAILFEGGKVFLNSIVEKFPWSAIRKKVFKKSYLLTFWLACIFYFHKKIGTWHKIDRFMMLTDLSKRIFLDSSTGIKESQIVIKPNFVPDEFRGWKQRENCFLFVGRLTEEKGIKVLINAIKNTNFKIKIAGTGELIEELEYFAKNNENVNILGQISTSELKEHMATCSALIFPSIQYEGMPISIIEAFSMGLPVISSDLGAMKSMIFEGENGLLFPAGDSVELRKRLYFWEQLNWDVKNNYYNNARTSYLNNYSPQKILKQIIAIYDSVSR